MENLNDVFTKGYFTKLETFALHMRQKLDIGGYSGARKAKAQGNSLEFSDYREYRIGDDLRRIDWNSYARFEKLYMKIFLEEKQASINLFVDSSNSMSEGNKSLYSKSLAASIAYIALKNMDKVNLFGWSDGLQQKKLNTHTSNQFMNVVQFLNELEQKGETSFTKTIKECGSLPLGRGISFIFSDFLTEDNWKESMKLLQYKKQEIILVWVLGQQDVIPSQKGSLRLVDKETGETRDLELTADVLKNYQKALESYEADIREFCKKRGIVFVKAVDDMPLLKVLYNMLISY
ncbi:MAG: DUF58 domain-containing protein [Firmicutes bacterium]|jgi:uncharacterized protein (DUF58 family)|nr:DUF58 domain-containing protein [Bacillota bacterium]